MKKGLVKRLIVLLCLASHTTYAQTKVIDSLKQTYSSSTGTAERLKNLFALGQFHQSLPKDTLYKYAVIATSLTSDKTDKGNAAILLINAYLRLDKTDSAELTINKTLPLFNVKNQAERNIYFSLAALQVDCYGNNSNYEDATSLLYKIIQQAEQYNDPEVLAKNMGTLGVINYNLNHVPEAFNWYFKGLSYCKNSPEFYNPSAVLYINLAETYRWVDKPDSASYFINKAIPLCEKTGNLFYLANALRVKANIYSSAKNYAEAEKTMLECNTIREQTQGKLLMSNEMLALAVIHFKWGKLDKAIQELTSAMALSDSLNKNNNNSKGSEADVLKISYYNVLARCYKMKGDEKNYASTLEKIIAEKDAFYEANSANTLASLQAKYELQKEGTIIKQQLDLTKKNYLIYGSIILAGFALLLFWVLFNNYRRKQKLKMEYALQEEKRLSAQSIIDAEEQERKRIAADLHDNIGAYASAIRADVEKLSSKGTTESNIPLQNLEQHSREIINSLRDTIWVLNKENITITGIGDRIKSYTGKLQPSYNFIQFHIKEEITNNRRINSQHALNIFRIIQEAIHNSLKYSRAENIYIEIISHETLMLSVTDDGIGIDEKNTGIGNGMKNMKTRANDIGMKISIQANKNKGTKVNLESNTTN